MSKRFWPQVVLVISLAFNLAIVVMYCFMPEPPHGPEGFEKRIVKHMSKADADVVRKVFGEHYDEFTAHRIAMESAVTSVREVLAKNPVDPDALKAAFEKARAARAESEVTMEQIMLEAAPNLSMDGRSKLLPPPPPGHPKP